MSRLGNAIRSLAIGRSAESVASAVADERDVGRGAPHVEWNEVRRLLHRRHAARPGDAAGRTRQHGGGRDARRFVHRSNPPVREHDEQGTAESGIPKALLEPFQVAADERADVGIDDGGGDPLVLLDLG